MSVGVTTCGLDVSATDLARTVIEEDLEAIVVLDSHGHAAGMVTRGELVRAYAEDDFAQLTAGDIMLDGIPTVPPDIPLSAAAHLMRDHGVRILFLTHHAGGIEYPAAFISYKHFLRHMAMADEADIRDLGIKAEREPPLEAFMRRRQEARRRLRSGPGS